jgi:membrane-associated protease RseP (regulator of RpoE activity)
LAESETSRFFRILDTVRTEFVTRDAYVREGVPTFIVPMDAETTSKINKLAMRLAPEGLGLVVNQRESDVMLQIAPVQAMPRAKARYSSPIIPILLFFATIVTVAVSGYYVSFDYVDVLRSLGQVRGDGALITWTQTALYTITIMSAVGLHEVGHYLAAKRHGVKATFPFFIPGIPRYTLGTFGAFIRQESPAANRNQLFDIGVSGPMISFVISMIASVVGYSISLPITRQQYLQIFGSQGSGVIFPPLIFLLLGSYVFPTANAYTYILHPLALAGWAGTLITFLNAFPIGQLDGGHVFRALLGKTWHRRVGYAMTLVMFLAGWWPMAILVLLLIRVNHPGTMDDSIPLSNRRKLMGLAFALMFVAVFTLSQESPLLLLLYG